MNSTRLFRPLTRAFGRAPTLARSNLARPAIGAAQIKAKKNETPAPQQMVHTRPFSADTGGPIIQLTFSITAGDAQRYAAADPLLLR